MKTFFTPPRKKSANTLFYIRLKIFIALLTGLFLFSFPLPEKHKTIFNRKYSNNKLTTIRLVYMPIVPKVVAMLNSNESSLAGDLACCRTRTTKTTDKGCLTMQVTMLHLKTIPVLVNGIL